MNKEFNRMRKLAGLMTEGLHTTTKEAPMVRMMKLAGLMTEGFQGRFYAPEYLEQKYGKAVAKKIEAEIDEMDPNSWDRFTGMESAEEVEDYIADIKNMMDLEEGLYTNQEAYEEPVSEAPVKKMTRGKFKAKIKEMMSSEGTIGQETEREVGSMYEASPEAMDRMSGLSPVSSVGSLIAAARVIISTLKEEGFEEEDIFDYIMDKVKTLPMDETLSEAKKEEEEAPEDVDIDVEAPVEDTADTTVDVNMDGTPDLDTGSPEFKKAFTTLIDAYNAAKPVGDPKYTQMLANTVTYFNKNMILNPGQPQA